MIQVEWKNDEGEDRVEIFNSWNEYSNWQLSAACAEATRQGIHELKETEIH